MVKRYNKLSRDEDMLLLDLLLSATDRSALRILLAELLTPKEKARLIERIKIAKAILDGRTYDQITKLMRASTYMISRVNREIVGAESKLVVTFLSHPRSTNTVN